MEDNLSVILQEMKKQTLLLEQINDGIASIDNSLPTNGFDQDHFNERIKEVVDAIKRLPRD